MEIPNEQGSYETTAYSYVETVPKPKLGTINNFVAYLNDQSGETLDAKAIEIYNQNFRKLVAMLSKLPRVTREFAAIILENRDEENGYGATTANLLKIQRIMRGFDVDGELNILQDYNIIEIDPPEEGRNSPRIIFRFHHRVERFLPDFCEFIAQSKALNFKKPIVNLNFDGF